MTRIVIDLDNTLYDLCEPWLKLYNADYPDFPITTEHILGWDTSKYVSPKCGKKIYDYFLNPYVWSSGGLVDIESMDITRLWQRLGFDLAICTTLSTNESVVQKDNWLNTYFPNIKQRFYITTHTKNWLDADFLIDDGLHNHNGFKGVSILYDQPWNRSNTNLLRAKTWRDVYSQVMRGVNLLEQLKTHKTVESWMVGEEGMRQRIMKAADGIIERMDESIGC